MKNIIKFVLLTGISAIPLIAYSGSVNAESIFSILDEDISTNSDKIFINTTNIGTNTGDIADNFSAIGTNAGNITANTTNIGDIADNFSAINFNATNIAANAANIAALAARITALEALTSKIFVLTVSESLVGLNGTYASICHEDGAGGVDGSGIEGLIIAGNTWTHSSTIYTLADCAGDATVDTITATIEVTGSTTVTGWVGGTGESESPPFAADGSGDLLNVTQLVSQLSLTVIASTNSSIPVDTMGTFFYVVDDTGTNYFLYPDRPFAAGGTLASNSGPLIKQ